MAELQDFFFHADTRELVNIHQLGAAAWRLVVIRAYTLEQAQELLRAAD